MTTPPWWERLPERLEAEREELRQAGIRFETDQELFARGWLRWHVWPVVDGQTHHVIVTFPKLYPYFRFEVDAPDLNLLHHQNPVSKTLCLIGRSTAAWETGFTVASFLRDQLPVTIQAGSAETADEARGLEEKQAEPYSEYYPYLSDTGTIALVSDEWMIPPEYKAGWLTVASLKSNGMPPNALLRGAVLSIEDEHGTPIVRADEALRQLCINQTIRGRWIRSDHAVPADNPETFFTALEELDLVKVRLRAYPVAHPRLQAPHIRIRAVLFPEERAWRSNGEGWTFVAQLQHKNPVHRKHVAVGERFQHTHYFVRTGRAGRSDLQVRVPELAPLRQANVVVVGCGCLGAPSALEFARAGVHTLWLIDDDYLDPATSARWPAGLTAAGMLKVEYLAGFLRDHYPYTTVHPRVHRLGAVRPEGPSDTKLLEEIEADSVSVIYDASAELGVHHFLSDWARERGVLYVSVSGTYGGWGGQVVRVRPRKTEGCWMCAQYAQHQDRTIPEPPSDPAGIIQPAGCASPTFTGTGFDLATMALFGVRLTAGAIASDARPGYPDPEWDVAIVSLRDTGGQPIAPKVETFSLRRHPGCPICTRKQA